MKQYVIDAFTDQVFHGNQAAVCLLDHWLVDEILHQMARENNFSDTAFVVKEAGQWHLRWFTPAGEIELCGHATLGTAYVLFKFVETTATQLTFNTLAGELTVTKDGDWLAMDFPKYALTPVPVTAAMSEALGVTPTAAYLGRDLVCIFDTVAQVQTMTPDIPKVKALPGVLVHVTAPGQDEFDYVARSFAPKHLIDEDPVCGVGHCHLVPYWTQRLGKNQLMAYQASERGGVLKVKMNGERVSLAGQVALYSVGDVMVEG
ncbi:PhzF family phenazine biosynthesis protein [Limosilactobacillus equigenerosi]|nr:PhzF family phenazine biosynthesis protein [Limosilactobacillus equigenerosi]